MKTEAQGHGRTGARSERTVAAALGAALALALGTACVPARAQERTPTPVSAAAAPAAWQPIAVPAALRPNGTWAPRVPAATDRGVATGSAAARPSTVRSRGFLSQVVFGSVGSIAGMLGGIYVGRGVCEVMSPCGGEDPGLGYGFAGIIAGSIVGTAAGTALGSSLAGVAPGAFGRRMAGAFAGLLVGAGTIQLVGGEVDYVLPLATFSVTQALVTTLLAPRAPEGDPR